jgi:glycosyltransferase involved in cell wall biosynthesis
MKPGTRFLFILYFTPPAPGTAPKRNFRILQYLSKKVEQSVLFTAGRPTPEIPGVDTFSTKAWDYRTYLRRKTRDGYLPEQQKASLWKQWGIKLINTFPFSIVIGEGGLMYFISLVRKGNEVIRNEKITHLYSSFRPFADHYIAYWLKKKNPQLTWIADFRDLIVDEHYQHIFFPKNHQSFFKKIFSTANLLTTVSDGLAIHLKEYNPNVLVVRNGIDGESQVPLPSASSHFTITYTGSMFLNTRNPKPVFEALQALSNKGLIVISDIRIQYAGKDSFYWQKMAAEYEFGNVLEDHGLVSDEKAQVLQQQSCINLLLTISSPELTGILTGKMIEYFQAGSPILAIVSGQNDTELSGMLDELEIGKSFSDQVSDTMNIENFIFSEYEHWKKSKSNRKPVKPEILKQKYSTVNTMAPLMAFIEKS